MFLAELFLLGVAFSAVAGLLLLLFKFFIYNIVRLRAEHYMSMILLDQNGEGSDPQFTIFQSIAKIMLAEFQAFEMKSEKDKIYRTFLPISKQNIELFWRFQRVASNSNIKVFIRPHLSSGVSGNFGGQTQRTFVDLLRVIGVCNRDKNKSMSFIISQYSFIELCTIFPASQIVDYAILRKLLKSTLIQLPEAISRLMALLAPFLDLRGMVGHEEGVGRTSRLFLEKSWKLLRAIVVNKIKREDQVKNEWEGAGEGLRSDEIEERVRAERASSNLKMKNCMKILGVGDLCEKEELGSLNLYNEWVARQKQIPKAAFKEFKNVHGVRVIRETPAPVNRKREGSHCRIVLSHFKLILMISVNHEVNVSLEQMKKKDGQPLVSDRLLKVERELPLVKKSLIDPERKESKNSLENELEFILYIKERGFRYLSTYYWEYERKRSEMESILMDPYPLTLRELLRDQGALSTRDRLLLLQQLTATVSWLADNYVCHRDIKPENVMIDHQRTPRLIDFGSCCPVHGVGSGYFRVKETRLLGTPHYYHPFTEQMSLIYRRSQYEQHLLFDAYSLGRVMREVLEEGVGRTLPNLAGLLGYVMERCEEQNPADRLTYQEMLFLFDSLLQYLH